MIWVEMMGQSGVGKSYWYKKIIKQEYPHLTPKSVLQRCADLSEIELSRRGYVKQWLRNVGMLPERYARSLDREIVNYLTRKYGVIRVDDLGDCRVAISHSTWTPCGATARIARAHSVEPK